MRQKKQQIPSGYTTKNKVKLIRGGAPYFHLLQQLIEQALDTIHLQFYIYDDDETGKQIAGALIAAARRNVQVYLIADGYASQALPHAFIQRLKEAGIHFRFFEPILKSKYFYFGRRMHHKLVVVDAKYAMAGGVNISNRYNDMPEKPAWLDFALYAEGEICKQLCVLCWKTWKGYPSTMGITPCEEKAVHFNINPTELSMVRMRRNDWVRSKNEISKSYVEMLIHASSHVTILCSYFLPGALIRKNISRAVKRGIKVKIIIAGLSDLITTKLAERYMYDWLLRNNIEIYEYQKNILHGKIAVCDSNWLTIGSYNVNNVSAYASIELNLDVINPSFAKEVEQTLEDIIAKDCKQVTTETHIHTKNIFKQFSRWCAYQFIRVAFYLFTFYFKHKK